MTFAVAVRHCLSNYATFSGRARRSEYWWFTLFVWLTTAVLAAIGAALANSMTQPGQGDLSQLQQNPLALGAFVLAGLFFLAMLMPVWAVGVRRFHDRDLSGWVYLALALAGVIPYIGWLSSLAALVITVLPTKPGGNRFGPDPSLTVADVF